MKRLCALIVVFIILIAFQLSFAQSQGPTPSKGILRQREQSERTIKQQKTDANSYGTENRPLVVKILNPEATRQQPSAPTQQKQSSSFFQNWLLVVFNGILAAFTILLWYSTHKMWKATRDTAKAARDSADALYATERAYVHAVARYIGSLIQDSACLVETELTVTKYGKTPAILNAIKMRWDFEPRIPEGKETDVFPHRFSSGILDKDPFTHKERFPLKAQDWCDIEASRKRLFFLVRIEYEDVFGKSDTKDFWWEYRPYDLVWSTYKDEKDTSY